MFGEVVDMEYITKEKLARMVFQRSWTIVTVAVIADLVVALIAWLYFKNTAAAIAPIACIVLTVSIVESLNRLYISQHIQKKQAQYTDSR